MFRTTLSVLLCLAFINADATAAPVQENSGAPQSLLPLLNIINERLEIADQVALTKWDSGQPVQDSERELKVIADAQTKAADYSVDKNEAAQLIAAQIEANKLVQYGLLSAWHAAGVAPLTQRPNLKDQIRPRLDTLQIDLLQRYAHFSPYRADSGCAVWLSHALPEIAKDKLHEMALIRATGELCISRANRS